jgi:hypothetical protein
MNKKYFLVPFVLFFISVVIFLVRKKDNNSTIHEPSHVVKEVEFEEVAQKEWKQTEENTNFQVLKPDDSNKDEVELLQSSYHLEHYRKDVDIDTLKTVMEGLHEVKWHEVSFKESKNLLEDWLGEALLTKDDPKFNGGPINITYEIENPKKGVKKVQLIGHKEAEEDSFHSLLIHVDSNEGLTETLADYFQTQLHEGTPTWHKKSRGAAIWDKDDYYVAFENASLRSNDKEDLIRIEVQMNVK